MKKNKLFGTLVVIVLLGTFMTSCRGTYPTSFVHADAINFGDNVNANFNTKTYEGVPFNLYVENVENSSNDAASAFNKRKKQNEGANIFAELEKEINSAKQQENTAGIYAMDVALRRVKHMQKEYNRDINVKYTIVYITDGLDNISVQAAKNNLTFPQKKNYKTPDKYKKNMTKRIKRISRYKKDVKNQFDIFPMVFTGTDLLLVESDMIYRHLTSLCGSNNVNVKNLTKDDIRKALNEKIDVPKDMDKEEREQYINKQRANNIQAFAKANKEITIPSIYILTALEKAKPEFDNFIEVNMNWMRGSSRGIGNDGPEIIKGDNFDEIKKDFESEFATSSFEFQVPKGYVNQGVEMSMKDTDGNEVSFQGTLKKTMFGKYYLKNVSTSDNFDFVGTDKNGNINKIKSINKSRKDSRAIFVVAKPRLIMNNGESKNKSEGRPFIVDAKREENDGVIQRYLNNGYWVVNSEYDAQASAEVKNYIQLIFDCSLSMNDKQIAEEKKTLIEIAEIVREKAKDNK